MNIESNSFYYLSSEGFSPELPVTANFVKKLKTENNREAVLIKCAENISRYKTDLLVLVPKHLGCSLLKLGETDIIFTYVIHGAKYLNKDFIDLKPSSKMILDWGAITFSLDIAKKWQVKETEI